MELIENLNAVVRLPQAGFFYTASETVFALTKCNLGNWDDNFLLEAGFSRQALNRRKSPSSFSFYWPIFPSPWASKLLAHLDLARQKWCLGDSFVIQQEPACLRSERSIPEKTAEIRSVLKDTRFPGDAVLATVLHVKRSLESLPRHVPLAR